MKETRTKPRNKKIDLKDSTDDVEHLQNDETTINLPDVKDIPGQEHINVPNMDQFKDATISSDDEEGKDVWTEQSTEEALITDETENVTPLEKEMLEMSANDMPTKDEQQLRRAALDDKDDDGELLNEKASAISGSDLDIPGADDDNADENIGEEDEENNSYSLGGDEQSQNEERSGV